MTAAASSSEPIPTFSPACTPVETPPIRPRKPCATPASIGARITSTSAGALTAPAASDCRHRRSRRRETRSAQCRESRISHRNGAPCGCRHRRSGSPRARRGCAHGRATTPSAPARRPVRASR
ncbi:unnamed protein product [Rhizophagus irregularis]|uniref:Uncharacterized protein n=1 Tax=Rhizophagus irregularis TaxID=588596 RepID=A0A916EBZ1_9GLOM|nr:unnamed protein product [Rhizophagus irregularis]